MWLFILIYLLVRFSTVGSGSSSAIIPTSMSSFNALLIKETDAARLFNVVGREIWIPKSVTTTITKIGLPDLQGRRECLVDVLEWFAEKEDL